MELQNSIYNLIELLHDPPFNTPLSKFKVWQNEIKDIEKKIAEVAGHKYVLVDDEDNIKVDLWEKYASNRVEGGQDEIEITIEVNDGFNTSVEIVLIDYSGNEITSETNKIVGSKVDESK
jgi:hypothetical protein